MPWPVRRSRSFASRLSSSARVTCSAISSWTSKMSPGAPIEAHRPDVGTRLRVDELGRHPHPRAVALHAAFEQEARAELLADLARVLLPVAERERRGPRNDLELRQVRELVQHGFGDAERENLALVGGAQVLERQHRDGRARATRTREVRLPYQQHGDRHQQHSDDRDVGIAAQPVH